MGLFKEQLVFDTANPDDGDNVGAYVRAGSDGDQIASQTISAEEWLNTAAALFDGSGNAISSTSGALDVNVANAADIEVASNTEFDEDAAHTTGDKGNFVLAVRQDTLASSTSADGDYAAFKTTSLGRLYVDAEISGSSGDINVTGNVAHDAADSGNPVKIGYKTADAALTEVSAAADRSDAISDMYGRPIVNPSASVAMTVGAETVTTTAAQIASTALSGRIRIGVQNLGTKKVYLGHSASVTSSNGLEVSKKGYFEIELGEHVDLYAIAQSGSQDIRVIEIA